MFIESVKVEDSIEVGTGYLKNRYYPVLLQYLAITNQSSNVKYVMFFGQYVDVMYTDHSWIDVSYSTLDKYKEI